MKRRYNAIYLSPHLDDVALSCGGQIYDRVRRGEQVLIVTVMGGTGGENQPLSEFAGLLHERWGLSADVVEQRRVEDQRASEILGVDYLHLPFADSIYRIGGAEEQRPLYQSEEEIFGPIDPTEANLLHSIEETVRMLPDSDEIYAPLTVGNHVDHQIVKQVASQVYGNKLRYYEDYPYCRNKKVVDRLVADTKAEIVRTISISQAGIRARILAIWAYESQISSFFDSFIDLESQIEEIVTLYNGERIWNIGKIHG